MYQLIRVDGETTYNPYRSAVPEFKSDYSQAFEFDADGLGNMMSKVSTGGRYLYEMLEELGKKKKVFEIIDTYFSYKRILISGDCKDISTRKTEKFTIKIDADTISYMFFE